MKKMLALTLALLLVVSMFAACDNKAAEATQAPAGNDATAPQGNTATEPTATEAPATTPTATEPTVTEPTATEPTETEPVDEKYIVIDKLNKHENGWNQDAWGNGSYGIFFSVKTNDAPFGEGDDSVYYRPVEPGVIKLYRDGEVYELGRAGVDFLHKSDRNTYYLRFEEWMVRDYFPITNGDVILVDGDFYHGESEYTLHFEPVYMILNGDMVKFSTTAPESIQGIE